MKSKRVLSIEIPLKSGGNSSTAASNSSTVQTEHTNARSSPNKSEPVQDVQRSYSNNPTVGINISMSQEKSLINITDLVVEKEDKSSIIAEGTSSAVYRARHIPTGKFYALKQVNLSTGDVGDAEKYNRQIQRELQTLSNTAHPNIIDFFGAYYADGKASIILEWMDLGSLDALVNRCSKFPEPVVACIARQSLEGLRYLRIQRLVHRDIKPSNILVNSRGQVKIADFGLTGRAQQTQEGLKSFCGTVTYMAPERIRGQKHTVQGDIWSLGLTLMHMTLGHFPYNVNPDTGFWELLFKITEEKSPFLGPEYSPEIRDFLGLCLIKEPERRPFAEDLLKHSFLVKYSSFSEMDLSMWLRENVRMP